MTDGIIHDTCTNTDMTFIKQITDNFNVTYSQMIIDYWRQSRNRLMQELIKNVRRTLEENYPKLDFSMIVDDTKE